jgi:peptidoglycan L-alanyl-D-glutamate endopeptidase CwlK
MRLGSSGPDVAALQLRLLQVGFNPGEADGNFGPATRAAVLAYQQSEGLLADGEVGPRTATALGLDHPPQIVSAIPAVTVEIVSKMFPATPVSNIRTNLPVVLNALVAPQLVEKTMVLMALATIRAETESFLPISEGQSVYNTSPGGPPFDLYDNRKDLGNQGPPDGERYRGRGFVQLTGRANYTTYGPLIGLGDGLVNNPEQGNQPEIAARLLAGFLKNQEKAIKEALLHYDRPTALKMARRLVNGGSNGLDRFAAAYQIGDALLPELLSVVQEAG